MHIAINAWFWNSPNTGSGQYLRRLIFALAQIAPDLRISLILPPHAHPDDTLPPNITPIRTKGRSGALGKVWFEQRTFRAWSKPVGRNWHMSPIGVRL